MNDSEHMCWPPLTGRKTWWTCDDCHQVWRKVEGRWKLTGHDPQT